MRSKAWRQIRLVLLLGLLGSTTAHAESGYETVLRTLGEALAEDCHTRLTTIRLGTPRGVTLENRKELTEALLRSMALVSITAPGRLEQAPAITSDSTVTMSGERTPAQVAESVVTVGAVLVRVTWHFAGSNAMKSYAVFSADGAPLFDSLLSMPVVPVNLLRFGHL